MYPSCEKLFLCICTRVCFMLEGLSDVLARKRSCVCRHYNVCVLPLESFRPGLPNPGPQALPPRLFFSLFFPPCL